MYPVERCSYDSRTQLKEQPQTAIRCGRIDKKPTKVQVRQHPAESTYDLIISIRPVLLLAHFPHSPRRGEWVRFLRNFCRADEATAMPLDDASRPA